MNNQKIINAGGIVRTLTTEQKDAWRKKLSPVWAKFAGDISQDMINATIVANK